MINQEVVQRFREEVEAKILASLAKAKEKVMISLSKSIVVIKQLFAPSSATASTMPFDHEEPPQVKIQPSYKAVGYVRCRPHELQGPIDEEKKASEGGEETLLSS